MHKIDDYINLKLKELGITDSTLSLKANISQGQISKLKNGKVSKLSAKIFYKLVVSLDANFEEAITIVFPKFNKIKLKKLIVKKRNAFGVFMLEFENCINTPSIIAKTTGISEERIFDLFYRNGSLDAYELLLIEKALDKKPGELFQMYYTERE